MAKTLRKKSPKKKHQEAADKLWAELVKLRALGKCEMCGTTSYLNSHHIFSRDNRSVRWDVSNGVCLCAGHHALCNNSAHKAPADFVEWIKDRRGLDWYEDLRVKAHDTWDGDIETVLACLKEMKNQFKGA